MVHGQKSDWRADSEKHRRRLNLCFDSRPLTIRFLQVRPPQDDWGSWREENSKPAVESEGDIRLGILNYQLIICLRFYLFIHLLILVSFEFCNLSFIYEWENCAIHIQSHSPYLALLQVYPAHRTDCFSEADSKSILMKKLKDRHYFSSLPVELKVQIFTWTSCCHMTSSNSIST